jgi:mediator of RNA polymerase II transcription subunit 10
METRDKSSSTLRRTLACHTKVKQRTTLTNPPSSCYSKNLTLALSTLSTHTTLPPNAAESIATNNTSDPSNPPLASIQLPPEIIEYVDAARNPDIYTREFVELVQRGNQDLKGKREAFADFRDVLAREMRSAMPECRGEVDRVVSMTGGTAGGEDREDGASK